MVVTDYVGKVVEWSGTQTEALHSGFNVDCTDCYQCTGCLGCTNCSQCNHCRYCKLCTNCTWCANCIDCTACFHCCDCDKQPLAFIATERWSICIRADKTIKIGCKDYSVDDWMNFTDADIHYMADGALSFWRKWRPVINTILENN